MSKRVCSECPELIDVGTRDGRCATHRREREKARGSSTERGYDYRHQQHRAAWQRRIDAGEVVYCWRCKATRITGRDWHDGHDDEDRSVYRGPECVPCNTATAGRR